ncbi:RagB/SusD family nutrient uptake outer membrane protein [Arachidicoccus terrestris]|nr:RagB/SusD family nutrient uptake outer membrane protein [Arachidicoccus terrestris]UAY55429.1 RagB/SusD family nutrient uptake outer membrane protein [Arachidicoccus terrestris]
MRSQPQDALNMLRNRAGLQPIGTLFKQIMQQGTMGENAIEFAGEFCRS